MVTQLRVLFCKCLVFAANILIFTAAPVLAAIDKVPRTMSDFIDYPMTESPSTRVSTVKVVAVDYDLVARDFQQMSQRESESTQAWHDRVDQWLVNQTGFIATKQTYQETVNTRIQTNGETKIAYRPNDYNRAHLIPVEGGMMDAKGVGTGNPSQRSHSNGLGTLGEMIREFIYEKAVNDIFIHSGVNAKTVGCYAVLDYGFDVIHQDGTRSRAGYVLRQANQRSGDRISFLPGNQAIEVEKTLRRYGVTSSGDAFGARANGNTVSDYANIQGTNNLKTSEVIDFGAFLGVNYFYTTLTDHLKRPLLFTGSPDFVQPDSRLALPLSEWGSMGKMDPKYDKPWVYSHELAAAWAEGRAGRSDVETHIQNMLGPFRKKIGFAVRACSGLFIH
jgi:hypothetical protein